MSIGKSLTLVPGEEAKDYGKYVNKLAIIPGEEARVGKEYPHKNLDIDKIDFLVMLFDRHNCNISAVARDIESPYSSRKTLTYYSNLYNIIQKVKSRRMKRLEMFEREKDQVLRSAVKNIVHQALLAVAPREVEKYSMTGKRYTYIRYPTPKELMDCYKILKTELGEPSSITKQENINKEEKEQINEGLDLIKDLIDGVKKEV